MMDEKDMEDAECIKKCPYCKLEPVMDKRTSRLSNGHAYDEWKLHCENHADMSTIWCSLRSECVSKWNDIVNGIELA